MKIMSFVALLLLCCSCEIVPNGLPSATVGIQLISEEYINPNATIIERVSVKLIYGGGKIGEPISPYTFNGAFTDIDDIIDQFDLANKILEDMGSELGIDLIEIIDLTEEYYPEISQFHNIDWNCSANTENCQTKLLVDNGSEQNWDYFISLAKTGKFGWQDNMVNVYINGYSNSGGCDNASYLFMGSGSYQTTLLHELGHSLRLRHTHEEDHCDDTLVDQSGWSIEDITQNNPSATAKQIQETYYNVMSYRGEDRKYLTKCQVDRISKTLQDVRYSDLLYKSYGRFGQIHHQVFP
jgi:hypothetical protein